MDIFSSAGQGGGQQANSHHPCLSSTPTFPNTYSHYFQILLDLLLPSLNGPVYQNSRWRFTAVLLADSPSLKSEQRGLTEQRVSTGSKIKAMVIMHMDTHNFCLWAVHKLKTNHSVRNTGSEKERLRFLSPYLSMFTLNNLHIFDNSPLYIKCLYPS